MCPHMYMYVFTYSGEGDCDIDQACYCTHCPYSLLFAGTCYSLFLFPNQLGMPPAKFNRTSANVWHTGKQCNDTLSSSRCEGCSNHVACQDGTESTDRFSPDRSWLCWRGSRMHGLLRGLHGKLGECCLACSIYVNIIFSCSFNVRLAYRVMISIWYNSKMVQAGQGAHEFPPSKEYLKNKIVQLPVSARTSSQIPIFETIL